MRYLLAYLSACFVCGQVLAEAAFLRRDIAVGDRPSRVVVGDFNGDSRPDLAVNSFGGLSVLLNTGGGLFARPVTLPAEIHPAFGPTPTNYTVAADFNRDGRLDLAGAVDDTGPMLRRSVRVLLGRGDGTFEIREVDGGQLRVVDTGDFNGDRIPDLLLEEDSFLVVQLGNGQGYFQRGARIPRVGISVGVADFNRDGLSDLVANRETGAIAVLLNRGDGTFHTPVETAEAGVGIIADFNRDGVPDIASASEVLIGKGDGTFRSIRYIPSRRGFPLPFAAADFDGDGHVDLAGWLSDGETERTYISVFRGSSDGTLSLPVDYIASPYATGGNTAADLDGDRHPDLVISNSRGNSVTLLMPRTPGPNLNRAVSAASATAITSPESLATLYVATGAAGNESGAAPYPERLAGISLEVRDSAGVSRLAPLVFVSATQINFYVPAGTALGEATLAITNGGGSAIAGSMQVDAVAPALFMIAPANSTPAALAVRVSPDGRQTPVTVFNCFGPPGANLSCGPAPIRLSGDPIILTFFATGFRNAASARVTAHVHGVSLPVDYVGPQGMPGLDQINVRLLPEAFLGPPAFVTVAIDGVVANTALLSLVR